MGGVAIMLFNSPYIYTFIIYFPIIIYFISTSVVAANTASLKQIVIIRTHENISAKLIPKYGECKEFKRIEIIGDLIFENIKIKNIIRPFAYKCLSNILIETMMGYLNKAYADNGYVTTQVYIPKQDISTKIFKMQVVAGRIESIEIDKNQPLYKRQVALAFPVNTGDILNIEYLQQGIDNIKKRPSKNVAIKLQPGDKAAMSKVIISAVDQTPWRIRYETKKIYYHGIKRKTNDIALEIDNILGINDGFKLSFGGGKNSNNLNASITAPIKWADFTLTSDYSEYLSILTKTTELFGQSYNITANMDYILSRSPNDKLIANFNISKRMSDRYINNNHLTPQRLSVLKIGLKHIKSIKNLNLISHIGFSKGLSLFGAQKDPASATISTPRAQFFLLTANTSLNYVFKNIASISSKWNFQWSQDALYSDQQLNLGDVSATRGTGHVGLNADIGIATQHQIGFRLSSKSSPLFSSFLAKFEPYLFLDASAGKNIANARKYYASSIGGGLKFENKYLNFEISIAKPIVIFGGINNSKKPTFKINSTIKF